jgi:hypothetical protein
MAKSIATLDQQLSTAAKLLRLLREAGLSDEALHYPIDDSDMRNHLVTFWMSEAFMPSAEQRVAREILGKNFFGIEDWAALYGVNFSQKQLCAIAEFPWGEDVLNGPCPFYEGKAIRETHFAFLGLDRYMGNPLTIRKWQEIHPANGQPLFYSCPQDCWYKDEKFANDPTCAFRWYLMPLEIVPKSEYKTYPGQVAMLPAEYEVPFAVEEVTKDLLYHHKNGTFLNNSCYGRCQDLSSNDFHVSVGYFASDGFLVTHWADGCGYEDIGLAASRKLPSLAS